MEESKYYIEMSPEMRERDERNRREYYRIAGPLLAELAQAGYRVKQISDLVNTRPKINYRTAVPILLRWLPKIQETHIKESIIRALAVPWDKQVVLPVLVAEFEREPPPPEGEEDPTSYRWTVGDALSYNADDRILDDVIRLALDRRYGQSRQMLGLALGRMKDPRAVDALIALLDDPGMVGYAAMGLNRARAARARPYLEPVLNHKERWIRTEAQRAIAKIDKAAA